MNKYTILTLAMGLLACNATTWAQGTYPLHDAIKAGKPSAVKAAMKSGRINDFNGAGMTPLMVAAMYDRSTSARTLIAAGANADLTTTQYGTTALMMAAINGYHEVVAELIAGGANLNIRNKSGFTALMLAAQKGHADVVRLLVQAGADANIRDASQRTAMQHAATDAIRQLLTQQPPTSAAAKQGATLHQAIKDGTLDYEHPLLNAREKLNERDGSGLTPLMVAAMHNKAEAAHILLKVGSPHVNFNDATANFGTTALMMAAMNGYSKVVSEIIAAQANLDLPNKSGYTALMLAAKGGHSNVVRQLLQAGANRDLCDKNGKSALAHAANEETRTILKSPLGTVAGETLPSMQEAIVQLRQMQGDRARFAALRFSMRAGDGKQGYAYHFLGQNENVQLIHANDAFLVTTERVFGSHAESLTAVHFWDARTFAYLSSVLHNHEHFTYMLPTADPQGMRFAIAFYQKYSNKCGSFAYHLTTGTLEYECEFSQNAHIFENENRTPVPFKHKDFAGMPPFEKEADNIPLSHTLTLQNMPQFAGLVHRFSQSDENIVHGVDVRTLRSTPYTPAHKPMDINPDDIPGLPTGMKLVAVNDWENNKPITQAFCPGYLACIPSQYESVRDLIWKWNDDASLKVPLYVYDKTRKEFYPMPESVLEHAGNNASVKPEFGNSDCGKLLHTALYEHRWGANTSEPELYNPDTQTFEKIIFNGRKENKDDKVAYDIKADIEHTAGLGSLISEWNRIPGDDKHTYWLAAGAGICVLSLMDEETKTGTVIQSWQGAWGKSPWAPGRPNPVWLKEQRLLCLPMKDHCWDVYELADVTRPAPKKFTLYTGAADAWAIMLPNGHYAGSPGCESLFYEQEDGGERSIHAMAPWRNRPAEVLEAIGGNADDIAALRETTKRWLARKGMDIDNMPAEPSPESFPHATADNTPLINTSGSLAFNVRLTAADKKALTTLEVRADGALIPQAWDSSLLIPPGQSQTVQVTIPLRAGQNNIELTPVDSMGLSGEPVTFRAVHPGQAESQLYVVALGVSDYDDDSLDLQFAAKDARDLVSAFTEHVNGTVNSLVLTDKEVSTPDVLDKVRQFLANSRKEDRVILYVAGHGMLDDNLEYHYAPASFNVEQVNKTGISMKKLTGILQHIPARERLLLLDTCHSGQLGEAGEEQLVANGVQLPHGVRAIHHRGMKVKKAAGALTTTAQQKRYIEESFSLGQEYRGVNIVAGAAGAEYALESGEWNNGVFTAAVIQTIKHPQEADQNTDGMLAVDEMLTALQQKVTELTGGAQKPNIVSAENSSMTIITDVYNDILTGNWMAFCERIRKAKSTKEVFLLLDIMESCRHGIVCGNDAQWDEKSQTAIMQKRGRGYEEDEINALKQALEKGKSNHSISRHFSYYSHPSISPEVCEAAISKGISAETLYHQFFRFNSEKDLEPLRILLENGVNPDIPGNDGNTMLHRIARWDSNLPSLQIRKLHLLLKHGADRNLKNNKGEIAVPEDCQQAYIVNTIASLVQYCREHQQPVAEDGYAPASLDAQQIMCDYSQAEESEYDAESEKRTPFTPISSAKAGTLMPSIPPSHKEHDNKGFFRLYCKTGPNTARLITGTIYAEGVVIGDLVSQHQHELTGEQMLELLSPYFAENSSTLELSFTSPTTATATSATWLDDCTQHTMRNINITICNP
ncbi:MAG: ankyrin repeat domain-containing protein [Akkermansia sp.]|nr:ankyrin repeat domain-containing protein [Akkermansia sp.]